MAISREPIYAALFARLQSKVTLCKTFARKWIEPQQIGQDQQPALLCLEGKQTPNDRSPLPPIWTLEATIVVYARTNDTATPGTILSNILDQIESALEIQPAKERCSSARSTARSECPPCRRSGSLARSSRKTER
jgi:hypothetical protein